MHSIGKVAVLAGGFSAEREVSLNSGRAILAALQSKGVDAHLFDPAERGLSALKTEGFQAAFNILHGTYGEDGTVQGALEALGIPYTGSGVLTSALGMDKYRSKLIWQALGLPLFIKPAAEGSSVGVYKVKTTAELETRYRELRGQNLHGEILAERFMSGGEYTCAIVGGQALPTIRIIPANEFYDYEAKYLLDNTVYQCPSDLGEEHEKEMRSLALRAFEALGGRDSWARVDFLRDENGKLYLLEINTVPGMTDHSLVPKAALEAGIGFADLCLIILQTARA